QCWANIFRENHPTLGLHGHPNGADGVTGTYYPDHGDSGENFGGQTRFTTSDESEFCYTVTPRTGLINFFECNLKHMITAYSGKRERISIAWDIAFTNPEKNCYIPLLE
ncbi:MAG: putative 2OG-Fe(II) oxygenase, partial [Verrucomicrobia bacterium]|nr:putative 2OG-Fe(II) oxygenase [Verrucomicrobiota bacterium]